MLLPTDSYALRPCFSATTRAGWNHRLIFSLKDFANFTDERAYSQANTTLPEWSLAADRYTEAT